MLCSQIRMFKKRYFRNSRIFLTFHRKFMQSLFEFHFNFRSIKIWFSYNFFLNTQTTNINWLMVCIFNTFLTKNRFRFLTEAVKTDWNLKAECTCRLIFHYVHWREKTSFIQSVCGLCSLWETWTSQNSFQQNLTATLYYYKSKL